MNTKKSYGKYTLVAIFIAAATVLGGCNTVAGVGEDVQAAGEKTTEAAHTVSNKL
ncbi:MAG: entericidin A/B family lipoprotein [Halioglobus sp.]|jgi:predicted small secreted protein|nr:entericidin A/B family lipoprotein [Halioglobus sp.]